MKVLVIGSGGREHAICSAFAKSGRVKKLYCAPGNAGISALAECVEIKPEQIDALADFAQKKEIDLTFVGGETALALGIVGEFEKYGIPIVGASGQAARLESSKSFAKDFMRRHGIPTAQYGTANSASEAVELLNSGIFGLESAPVVVKADGLAAGKGVIVAADRADAISAINSMENLVGAEAAASIVLEECLYGREVSLLMFVDSQSFKPMPPTRDYKRIGEGDSGPNTGGIGTITDSSLLTEEQSNSIVEEMIKPTLAGCSAEGFPFRGILFLGLMMTNSGPKLLEYNVRFGDPETQSILVRLETDLVDICESMLAGTLGELAVKWKEGNSATIVLASNGYPEKPQTGDVIKGIDKVDSPNISVFHAGTSRDASGEIITSGGRVLSVTAVAENLDDAIANAYSAAGKISWSGMQYRRDIGK